MKLTNNAKILLDSRYFQANETWPKLAKRVSRTIASAEKSDKLKKEWSNTFNSIIESGEFLPATPFLMNAGNTNHFFSCYVLPIEDSLVGIYKTIADAAKIFQMAGGCGYDFSTLRPKNCPVSKNPKGVSSGPISFMQVFNASCKEIATSGARKGAQMGVMRIDHPDIEEFIDSKQDLENLTQFNISCAITDKFMQAVKNDEEFELVFKEHPERNKKVMARALWKKIVHNAWNTGDPGLLFIDEINRKDNIGNISSTNPCWAKGSLVSTEQGLQCIETIKVGQKVYVGDGKFETIKKIFDNGEQEIVKVSTNRGYKNLVTPEHKICVKDKGLVEAKDLTPGDVLIVQETGKFIFKSKDTETSKHKNEEVKVTSVEPAGTAQVFDFTTDGDKIVYVDGIQSLDCGEQPLPPYGCCDLGSIDLSKCFNKKSEFDVDRFKEIITIAVRFLDNAIDINNYTLPEIKKQQLDERRIGLGVMGFADALVEMGISYDSDEARHWAEYISTILENTSREASEQLAEEKGAFPKQNKSKLKNSPAIRNSMRTTVAPTGSLSIIAGCSAGIEPIFALVFTRKHSIDTHKELLDINKAFQQIAIERGFYSETLMDRIAHNNGSCQGLKEVPKDIQKIFKVAADIYPNDHVKMVATWQQQINSGISKTINLAEHATKEDIEKVYWQAYESNCKGVTIFRDKCRGGVQVFNTGEITKIGPAIRPDITSGRTMKVNTALGKMFITVNCIPNGGDEEVPFEVFITLSKGGTNASADAEAVGRLVSLLLRSKVEMKEIVKQLKGIGAGEVAFNHGRVVSSIPDAVSYVLEKMFLDSTEIINHPDDSTKYFPSGSRYDVCKDCG